MERKPSIRAKFGERQNPRDALEASDAVRSQRRLGRAIAAVRAELGLSQTQMAHRLDLGTYSPGGRSTSTARSAMSRLESGQRVPDEELLERIIRLHPASGVLLREFAAAVSGVRLSASNSATTPDQSQHTTDRRVPTTETASAAFTARSQYWWRSRVVLGSTVGFVVVVALAVLLVVLFKRDDPARLSTWTETTGSPAHTWSDFKLAAGTAGLPLGPRQSVQVSCRVKGYVVQDGDPWWYRIESPPWDGHFYASSDAFYNDGATSGNFIDGVIVDEQVPQC